jgi:anaerobic selenocysteine-containing dehydrogenase
MVEQMVDDDVHAALLAERIQHVITETFAFDYRPQLLTPALEVYSNKDSFTGRPVESMAFRRLPATERKYAYTSSAYVNTSKILNTISFDKIRLSPVQIEHLVQGYFGWVGSTVAAAVSFTDYPRQYAGAEKITDIPASTIRRLTKEFSDAAEKYEGAANCYRSRKSTWYYQDYEFRRAQAILNSIHGCVNRPGGVTLGTKLKGKNGKTIESYEYEDFPIYDNAKGRIDTGTIADGQYPLANPTKGSWQILRDTILEVNTKWDKAGRPKPDADGNYKGLSENEYPVRGFFIYKQNPMQSVPDYDKTAEMLKSVDLVVTIDIVANDTAYYSDYILPDITYIERESLVKHFGTNEPFIGWRSAAKEPEGESKHIYYMCNELTKRIEKPFADITFKYTWEPDDESLKLPKDFKITKYLNEDFEVEEAKLKADIKDEKLVNAIVEHAGEDGLDIATYKITEAFKESIPEFNKRVMSETFGEEAAKIAKEYGVYMPISLSCEPHLFPLYRRWGQLRHNPFLALLLEPLQKVSFPPPCE